MDEVLQNMSSASWWFGVVLVGLTINLVAAYLKPRMDSVLSRVSKRWAANSAIKREEREARILTLIASEHEQILNRTEELRLRIRSFCYTFDASLLFLLGFSFQFIPGPKKLGFIVFAIAACIALFIMLIALSDWHMAMRNREELDTARSRCSALNARGIKMVSD